MTKEQIKALSKSAKEYGEVFVSNEEGINIRRIDFSNGAQEVLNNLHKYGLMSTSNGFYEALYCSCIYTDGYSTLSVHLTKEGAEKAIQEHKDEEKARFIKLFKDEKYLVIEGKHEHGYMMWNDNKDWDIREIKLQS